MINEIEIELEADEVNRYELEVDEVSRYEVESDQAIIIRHTDLPFYDGPYEVTPRLETQTLGTELKAMEHDVTVHEIPVTRTSNPYDGITVLIG